MCLNTLKNSWFQKNAKHEHMNMSSPNHRYFYDSVTNTTSLSHTMRPGLQIRHFWVAKSLFLTITFNQKKQDKTFWFWTIVRPGRIVWERLIEHIIESCYSAARNRRVFFINLLKNIGANKGYILPHGLSVVVVLHIREL